MGVKNFQACKFAIGSVIGKYFFSQLARFGLSRFEMLEFKIEGVHVHIKSDFHNLIAVANYTSTLLLDGVLLRDFLLDTKRFQLLTPLRLRASTCTRHSAQRGEDHGTKFNSAFNAFKFAEKSVVM